MTVLDGTPGDIVETGVGNGGTLILMVSWLLTLTLPSSAARSCVKQCYITTTTTTTTTTTINQGDVGFHADVASDCLDAILQRGVLKTLGDRQRVIWGADSFEGLPDRTEKVK